MNQQLKEIQSGAMLASITMKESLGLRPRNVMSLNGLLMMKMSEEFLLKVSKLENKTDKIIPKILEEVNSLFTTLHIPVEMGKFSDEVPDMI